MLIIISYKILTFRFLRLIGTRILLFSVIPFISIELFAISLRKTKVQATCIPCPEGMCNLLSGIFIASIIMNLKLECMYKLYILIFSIVSITLHIYIRDVVQKHVCKLFIFPKTAHYKIIYFMCSTQKMTSGYHSTWLISLFIY